VRRLSFICRSLAVAAAPAVAPLARVLAPPVAKCSAIIEAEYPEFGPAAGNVVLRMMVPDTSAAGWSAAWRNLVTFSHSALGTDAREVLGSVEELQAHAVRTGYYPMVMSSVDNLLADLKAAAR
jgi:hypothetical protein